MKCHVAQRPTPNDGETKIIVSVHEGVPRFTSVGHAGADRKTTGCVINLWGIVTIVCSGSVAMIRLYNDPLKRSHRKIIAILYQ